MLTWYTATYDKDQRAKVRKKIENEDNNNEDKKIDNNDDASDIDAKKKIILKMMKII